MLPLGWSLDHTPPQNTCPVVLYKCQCHSPLMIPQIILRVCECMHASVKYVCTVVYSVCASERER